MFISEIFRQDNIIIDLKSTNKEDLFKEVVDYLVKKESGLDRDALLHGLWEREKKMTTGIAKNIALPHTHVSNLGKTYGVLGISQKGIDYQSLDGKPVHIVLFLVGDDNQPDGHLMVLKNIALLMTNPEFYPTIMKCKTPREVAATIGEFEELSKFYFS
jgi:nitrogen PTS system EIIA component